MNQIAINIIGLLNDIDRFLLGIIVRKLKKKTKEPKFYGEYLNKLYIIIIQINCLYLKTQRIQFKTKNN